ncbi:uncharacterized protein N7515_006471 [Penicillium bovifimosum]|uniref:Transcription factor domain-containing protein n=1 Tax=Penicillium bovifimosum TaxID=126998 RepID=A0A9W9GUU4_9EURO|nr:uncharacterized protein N7515_006471 [Penicillium bovifimosum]KAJ5130432.1 hypothetical protein N7515_006471 [Penicillium bovifimosum]
MSARLAACEACRKAKLACDHKQPDHAFQAEKSREAEVGSILALDLYFKLANAFVSSIGSPDEPPSFNPRRNPYPNPGYLGSSSHAAIFKHITPEGDHGLGSHQAAPEALHSDLFGDNHLVLQGADILKHLLTTYKLSAMKDLVMFWLAKGANLALAEPFVNECAQSVSQLFSYNDDNWHLVYARCLMQNSAQPLQFNDTTDLADFSAQFLDHNARWETLGIFFAAVTRATIDIAFFPSLYTTEQEQYTLRRLCTKLCDFALEISLSLDCLNDLQLIMQYENFIVHSYVDGDQSYHSWRKLGDAISSTFALGYHENIETKPNIPPFLQELRKTAFARIYSADKNIAIFLGRPPRMNKRFCHFQIPSCHNAPHSRAWSSDAQAGYRADTRWSALCASLKEEIWELLQDKHDPQCASRASAIQRQAETQWQRLPPHFRLESSLKECTQGPFERDFVAGVRLHHLHVLFLIRLLLLKSPTEPDAPIIETAGQMLTLVVEIILLRDQLTNSGTGLIWKVAYYGLPAAGILLLAMLKQHMPRMQRTRSLQDLSVFVAEVQIGTIVRAGDPNYALLSKATRTIQRFLDSTHSDTAQPVAEVAGQEGTDEWATLLSLDLWDFEAGFWQSLADHPSLLAIEPSLPPL